MTTQTELAQRLLHDERFYIEKLIQIDDRDGKPVTFVYNAAQEILHQEQTHRTLVIKARQLGITTFFLARGLRKVLSNYGQTAVCVAHEEFITQRLLQRVQVMYDSIPDKLKPKIVHKSSYEKSFPSLNSVFYIGTAGARVFGRGEPIHFFIGSEIGFWPNAWNILTPTMESVPLDGEMFLEGTPNGEGDPESPDPARHNALYDLVQEALSDSDSVWHLIQLYWWLEERYRLPYGSPHALESDRGHLRLLGEEKDLIKRAGWKGEEAEERIRWRRRKIKEVKAAFWQEFFEDLESCFLASGLSYYDSEHLERLRASCYDPPIHKNNWEIWNEPAPADEHPVYSLDVDPGQGKITRSVATVWRHDLDDFSRVRHEATFAGLYDSGTFGPLVKQLGRYYHNACIAGEANGHGVAFCMQLHDYPNVYYRTEIISGLTSRQIGWMTTGSPRIGGRGTKPYMMGQLNELLSIMECHDLNIIRELMQVRLSGDQVKFLSSDDYHDSTAIMAATRPSNTMKGKRGLVGVTGWSRR